jgi:hypothetical protein
MNVTKTVKLDPHCVAHPTSGPPPFQLGPGSALLSQTRKRATEKAPESRGAAHHLDAIGSTGDMSSDILYHSVLAVHGIRPEDAEECSSPASERPTSRLDLAIAEGACRPPPLGARSLARSLARVFPLPLPHGRPPPPNRGTQPLARCSPPSRRPTHTLGCERTSWRCTECSTTLLTRATSTGTPTSTATTALPRRSSWPSPPVP